MHTYIHTYIYIYIYICILCISKICMYIMSSYVYIYIYVQYNIDIMAYIQNLDISNQSDKNGNEFEKSYILSIYFRTIMYLLTIMRMIYLGI